MRTFIAVELTAAAQRVLSQTQQQLQERLLQQRLGGAVRWTAPANVHLTLRFLGDTASNQRRQIAAGLAEIAAGHTPFSLSVAGVGCFPNLRQPSVIWLGLVGALDRLARLQGETESLARQAGFTPETRPFSAHLTIGRTQRSITSAEARGLGQAMQMAREQGFAQGELLTLPVDDIVLMQSVLQPGGSQYTPLGRWMLGAAPPSAAD